MKAMKAVIAMPVLFLALNAAASCPVQHPREVPAMPDAAVASKEEMHRARLEAEQYLSRGKIYLDCGLMNRRQYNQLLSQLEMFSERYNDELAEYQDRSRMIAEIDQTRALPAAGTTAK